MGYRNLAPRRANDDYQTPYALAFEACKRLAECIPVPKCIVEPSAGIGAFVHGSRSTWPTASITAIELRDDCKERLEAIAGPTAVIIDSWEKASVPTDTDLVIGNPPYELALPHLQLALHRVMSGGHVAFLLRMAFLSTQKRVHNFWDKQPGFKYLIPLAQRVSFTGDGKNEHSEHALYVFEKGYLGNATILPHLWIPNLEDAEQ